MVIWRKRSGSRAVNLNDDKWNLTNNFDRTERGLEYEFKKKKFRRMSWWKRKLSLENELEKSEEMRAVNHEDISIDEETAVADDLRIFNLKEPLFNYSPQSSPNIDLCLSFPNSRTEGLLFPLLFLLLLAPPIAFL